MEIKQLRTFLAIAGSGSITRASEILHVVQPALSRQLRLLEDDLGTPLFERGPRGMQLTDAGLILVDHAHRALQELDQAKSQIGTAPQCVTGTVSIGLLPSVSDLLAGPLVGALQKQYPKLSVRVSVAFAGYLQKWLESGEVDVALLYFANPPPSIEVTPLLDERLYLVGMPDAGLRPDTPVKVRKLESMPLIMPSNTYGLRLLVEHACAVAGTQLRVVAETNDMGVQKSLVEHGVGYTVLPGGSVFEDIESGRLSAAPLTAPDVNRRLVVAQSVTRNASVAVRRTVVELRSLVRSMLERDAWPSARWIDPE